VLRRAGFDVTVAETVAQARALAPMLTDVHLALIDLQLPDGDGAALALDLNLERVVLTSGTRPDDLDSILEGRSDWTFLQKPFQIPALLALL
jgi:DNA-binding response OmpR family regulator